MGGRSFAEKHEKRSERISRVRYFKGLGTELPSHIVAPKLVLTAVGYCPEEDGQVVQLKRGIRYAKRRQGPSAPRGRVNWQLGAIRV